MSNLQNLRPWKPGQSGNTGRKKWLTRIDEMCAKDGKHPYEELMKLLPELRPREQAEIWLQLLSYCQAKPKPLEAEKPDDLDDMPTEELLRLVKSQIKDMEGA